MFCGGRSGYVCPLYHYGTLAVRCLREVAGPNRSRICFPSVSRLQSRARHSVSTAEVCSVAQRGVAISDRPVEIRSPNPHRPCLSTFLKAERSTRKEASAVSMVLNRVTDSSIPSSCSRSGAQLFDHSIESAGALCRGSRITRADRQTGTLRRRVLT